MTRAKITAARLRELREAWTSAAKLYDSLDSPVTADSHRLLLTLLDIIDASREALRASCFCSGEPELCDACQALALVSEEESE